MLRVFLSSFLLLSASVIARAQQSSALEQFERADRNGDGKVSKDELRRPLLFKRLDRNEDGFIERSEVQGRQRQSGTKQTETLKPPIAESLKTYLNQRYASTEGVPARFQSLDVYTVENHEEIEPRPVMVMIHGGGWRTGDKSNRSMKEFKVPHFLNNGYVYVSINYRLSDGKGNDLHPVHVEDVAKAIAWVSENISEHGGDPEKIFVMGHSAGAHLAALVGVDERRLGAEGRSLSDIKGVICLDTAAYDIPKYMNELNAGPTAKKLYENAFGDTELQWKDASPRYFVEGKKDIPPMLFFHTGRRKEVELLSKEMAAAMRDAGIPAKAIHAPDKDHAGINNCIGQLGDRYTDLIMRFLANPESAGELSLNKGNEKSNTLPSGTSVDASGYDPLFVSAGIGESTSELVVEDLKRGRDIPLKVYLPKSNDAAPVILFSHGLGGTKEGSAYLGHHWSARGYVGVFLQHPGSDEAVWKDVPRRDRMKAMKRAASPVNFLHRVNDVPAVLDQLEKWNEAEGHSLEGRLDLSKIGMSGHSFGAVTTQAVSGQAFGRLGREYLDDRIDAALPMSTSSPKRGDPNDAFGSVSIPWMVMTGTKDEAIVGDADVESRLKVYPSITDAIDKYELVLKDGQHSAFTERPLPGDKIERNPNHHRVILALSSAFWDAYLRDDEVAKAWLTGELARSVMEEGDSWRFSLSESK